MSDKNLKLEIPMGVKVKDKVTDFEGIVTAKAEYLYGCNQYLVTPLAEGSDYKDSVWLDEGRLVVIDTGIKPEAVKADDDGGPERKVRY